MKPNPFTYDSDIDPNTYQYGILKIIQYLNSKPPRQSDSNPLPSSQQVVNHSQYLKPQIMPIDDIVKYPKREPYNIETPKSRKIVNRIAISSEQLADNIYYPRRNSKITDFFSKDKYGHKISNKKPEKCKPDSYESKYESQSDAMLREAQDKIRYKMHKISYLYQYTSNFKQKNNYILKIMNHQCYHQKQVLTKILKYSYYKRIQQQRVSKIHCNQAINYIRATYVSSLDRKIKQLREYESRKKNKKVRKYYSDYEDYKANDQDYKDKKAYMIALATRLYREKYKYMLTEFYYYVSYYQIAHYLLYKIQYYPHLAPYLPLAKLRSPNEYLTTILAMQMDSLNEEILTLIKFQPFTPLPRRLQLLKYIQYSQRLSRKLTPISSSSLFIPSNSISIFVPNTIVCSLSEYYLIIGQLHSYHLCSLKDLFKKCDYMTPEHTCIVKHIMKSVIRGMDELIDKTGGHNCPILPSNIFFTYKFDVKLVNMQFNNTMMVQYLKYILIKNQEDHYYPPGSINYDFSSAPWWSIGVLLYELTFGKKPFSGGVSCASCKYYFLILNELTFSTKPTSSDKCKELIKFCLHANGNGKGKVLYLLAHAYFTNKS